MNIGILGTGNVATNLAVGLSKGGHAVKLGSRSPAGKKAPAKVSLGTQAEATQFGEVLILAVPFSAVPETVAALGPKTFKGKVLVDATNVFPPPAGWGSSTSGAEEIAKLVPGAQVVKAFNTAFAKWMSSGRIGSSKILALVAGDDAAAKKVGLRLAADIGFDAVDAGPLRSARYMEAIALEMIHLAYERGMGPDIQLVLARA